MVRREADERARSAKPSACCAVPAGVSPALVGAGAPVSRPTIEGESPAVEAGCRKPLRREQPRGPQHEVKPAASSDSQSGSRAAHVTVKATSAVLDPERTVGPGGVRGVARVEGGARNTRGPSSRPLSGRAESYKPRAKSAGAERESEGVVVPVIPVQQNAGGGKDPWGGDVETGDQREGMAGQEPVQLPPRA